MIKKAIILLFMLMYLYTLTFDLFLTQFFRVPTPLLFCFPLIFFWGDIKHTQFLYLREIIIFLVVFLLFHVLVLANLASFFADFIIIVFCALYFNYFVRNHYKRFNYSIVIFISLLSFSAIIMFLNHVYPAQIDMLRSKLLGGPIIQSPAGISSSIFTFGYQIAALTSFIFIYALRCSSSILTKILVFIACLLIIYFGLNRSVVITFFISSILFSVIYYKQRVVGVLGVAVVLGAILYTFNIVSVFKNTEYDNVFAKEERTEKKGENRTDLAVENLKIYSNYPFGLIFYGKNWLDVTKDSLVFRNGLQPHNAYFQFITFLGPFLGLFLLILLYQKIINIVFDTIKNIKKTDYALLTCLCFSFFAVSLNASAHNSSLFTAHGGTIFLYFAILHSKKILDTRHQKHKSLNSEKRNMTEFG